jgi:hypothetical protein
MLTPPTKFASTMPFISGNGEMARLIRSRNWTSTSLGDPEDWPQSLKTTLSILINSKFPTVLFWGPDLICFYNDAFRPSLGVEGKHPWSLGRKGEEMWEEIWPIIKPWLDQVLAGGESIWMEDQLVPFFRNGRIEDIYWTFCYNAVFDETNRPAGVFVTCTETTNLIQSRKKLEESEMNFRNLVIQAPVGICIVKAHSLEIEIVNNLFLELVGRKREEMEHHSYWEVLKEAAGYYEPILQKVFDTGVAYTGTEHKVMLLRNGVEEFVYISFTYEPIRDENGTIERVMILGIDVTPQVLTRLKIEEVQLRERLAINVSQLGVFEIDLIKNEVIASPRLGEIFGLAHTKNWEHFIDVLHPEDIPCRQKAFEVACQSGTLRYEARITRNDGAVRWIRTSGTAFFDENRKPQKLVGVTQDITEQKEFVEELNKKVKERTIELQRKNAELELSNQKLEEFAHAASHDLKEPMRKIHFFVDRLKIQLADRLKEDEVRTLSRIEAADKRMVMLIDDMLQYSHVSQIAFEKELIDLNKKLDVVLDILEIDIQEKKAVIEIQPLPQLKGYRRQLQQLFQNLISNALKYSKEGIAPHISISSKVIKAEDYPEVFGDENNIKDYHLIEIADNGIGFEPEYADKIFKVFYRLHPKNEYSGTGVGLAIVRKVMDNHNGKIVAESKPGEGSVFRMFFPVNVI